MFTRILIPLDRSPLAEQAIPQGVALARAADAAIDLALVHVPVTTLTGTRDLAGDANAWDAEHRYLEAIVEELATGAGISATHCVLRGNASEMICRRAHDVGADLIVMTSHGRTGLSRAWVGSVADAVIRHASIPVLMLRPIDSKRARSAAHHLFKHVLVPVDAWASVNELLTAAASVARYANARLTLLRIVQPVPLVVPEAGVAVMYPPPLIDDAVTSQLVADTKDTLEITARTLAEKEHISVRTQVVVNASVGQAIVDFAHANAADLIAMSTHGRGASRVVLGSVADKVLRAAGLPMLMYRPALVGAETHALAAAPA